MSLERLNSWTVLILFFVGLGSGEASVEKPRSLPPTVECSGVLASHERAHNLYRLRGTERDLLFTEEPHYIRIRSGVPGNLRLVSPGNTVFRHYTSPEALKKILETGMLKAGPTPFFYSGYMSDYNVDLTGIFLTEPKTRASHVGVRPERKAFVDVRLPEGTGLLFLRDEIFLIPGPAAPEAWKVKIYRSSERGSFGELSSEFDRWDREGIPQPLEIPVEVVRYME